MNTDTKTMIRKDETNTAICRPCILCDDRCCGTCKYYDSVTSTCSDGTSRSPSSWCSSFAWG